MKYCLPILGMLLLGGTSTQVFAQSQGYGEAQQACEADVYKLCGQAIPDQDRIVACLRKRWSSVSKPCREAMADYGKHHHRHKSIGRHSTEGRTVRY